MTNDIFWTQSGARLKRVHTGHGKEYNWLFLPGGPGLGSESLSGLTGILDLPGTTWHLDLPQDGSNTMGDFANWSTALLEATSVLPNVILVAHSSGGMFALATPELEKNLIGLVLMDSAPDSRWQSSFAEYVKKHPLPEAEELQKLYQKSPSSDLLKKLTIACAAYSSTKKNVKKMIALFETLPFNYISYNWAEKHFDRSYKAKWFPQKIPTLIFAGDKDPITPLKLFTESPAFQGDNIYIYEIRRASHFPWIDNPDEVELAFELMEVVLDKTR